MMSDPAIQPDEREAALGPPRFTLRTLLAAMTLAGCLFGLMTAVGGVWSLVILLFASLVSAHVLGNSLATRLRDRASRASRDRGTVDSLPAATMFHSDIVPGRLTQRMRLSRVTPLAAFAGAAAGAFLGGIGSALVYPEAGGAAVALGVVSAGVLGAFAGFLTSSFISVVRQAWREALVHGGPARRPGERIGP